MTNKRLEEIASRIGRYEGIETINPNADIQILVNEVRRLLAERDSDRENTYNLVTKIRRLNVEIDGGIDDEDVPHQGWKDLADVLKKRVGELEAEVEAGKFLLDETVFTFEDKVAKFGELTRQTEAEQEILKARMKNLEAALKNNNSAL